MIITKQQAQREFDVLVCKLEESDLGIDRTIRRRIIKQAAEAIKNKYGIEIDTRKKVVAS